MSETPQSRPTVVVGAGAWGTALAVLLARNGVPTTLWARNANTIADLQAHRINAAYLPGVELPPSLKFSSDLDAAVAAAMDVLVCVPSKAFRATLQQLQPLLRADMRVMWATKGFDADSHRLLHTVVDEVLGATVPAAVVSGPTFAREVALGMPTAVTIASRDMALAEALAMYFHNDRFRAYSTDDVIGVEVGGAVKNILAIAAGISDGLGFGANARAALITRGLNEIMHFGVALGARRETLMGLAGLGDLVLTCTDDQSRNRRFGLALGRGKTVAAACEEVKYVVEGMHAAQEVMTVAAELGIEMPITEQVYQVIYHQRAPAEAVSQLLHRAPKAEGV